MADTRDDDPYRQLRAHLDTLPIGFPATESGVELRILRRLFTPEEAELALCLSAVPEPVDRIAPRVNGRTRAEVEQLLAGMAAKGVILESSGKDRRYSKAPLAVGIYEMQVDRLTAELQRDFEQYAKEAFGRAFLTGKTAQMRTIPIDARFVPERLVGRYDDARHLVSEGRPPWGVINCVCRQGRDLLGDPCRRTDVRRTCLLFGGVARRAIASGAAEELSRERAQALVDQAEREGLVLQPSNTQDPAFMCFCCGCCCGVLRMAKQFPRPAEYLNANFHAVIDGELCQECGTCLDRCPMEALRQFGGATHVDLDRCIGCGLCVSTCPSDAARLEKKARETVPPKDLRALYGRITVERFGVLGAAKIVGRALLHRRV